MGIVGISRDDFKKRFLIYLQGSVSYQSISKDVRLCPPSLCPVLQLTHLNLKSAIAFPSPAACLCLSLIGSWTVADHGGTC